MGEFVIAFSMYIWIEVVLDWWWNRNLKDDWIKALPVV